MCTTRWYANHVKKSRQMQKTDNKYRFRLNLNVFSKKKSLVLYAYHEIVIVRIHQDLFIFSVIFLEIILFTSPYLFHSLKEISRTSLYFLKSRQHQQIQKSISMPDMKLKPMHKPNKPPVLLMNVTKGMATSLLILVTYGLWIMT